MYFFGGHPSLFPADSSTAEISSLVKYVQSAIQYMYNFISIMYIMHVGYFATQLLKKQVKLYRSWFHINMHKQLNKDTICRRMPDFCHI